MKVRGLLLSLVLVGCGLLLGACGPTIGDPCTTPSDCLGRSCLNGNGWPGGYCSTTCTLGDPNSCPTGSVCIREGINNDTHGCYRQCNSTRDCRSGYRCENVRGSDSTVCVGP